MRLPGRIQPWCVPCMHGLDTHKVAVFTATVLQNLAACAVTFLCVFGSMNSKLAASHFPSGSRVLCNLQATALINTHSPVRRALQEELSSMAKGLGRHWEITLDHIQRIKWYAPHIRHVVLDIRCSATSAPADSTAAHSEPASQIPGGRQGKMPYPHMHSPAKSLPMQSLAHAQPSCCLLLK